MASTFHQFGLLPAELRIKIWEYNLRSSAPGFHIFSVKRRPTDTVSNRLGHTIPTQARQDRTYVLSNPIYAPEKRCPWPESDPTTYRVDAGLWSACKESRDIVKKHYTTLASPSSGHSLPAQHSPFTESTSGSSILPEKDLIIFQVAPDVHVSVGEALSALRPFFRDSATRPLHIAFEFTEDWRIRLSEDIESMKSQPGPRSCFIRLLERTLCGLLSAKLYLINYDSERAPVGSPVLFSAGGYDLNEVRWWAPRTVVVPACAVEVFVVELIWQGAEQWSFIRPMWTPGVTPPPLVSYLFSRADMTVLHCRERN
ncbi:hypothetical protein CSAL01_01069 [Colletotrichum salicis]|uniref:2EXR domain-containing protein n=1 Tax=Colletotrichum salicis TaxID=1209931 RepID=A0A135T0D6_9PEZI|nr:hypothetical protein CSAL01_01069 [Colletotrichum salicis]